MEGSFCLIGDANNGRWTIYILVAGLKVVHAVNIRWNALTFVYNTKLPQKIMRMYQDPSIFKTASPLEALKTIIHI